MRAAALPLFTLLSAFAPLFARPAARADLPDAVPTCTSPQPVAPAQTVAGSNTFIRSALAWNGREFAVAYWSSDGRLHFARIYADGTPAAAALTLTSRQTYAWAPSLVWNGAGYAVAWNEQGPSGLYNQVYFALLNPDGTMIGSELKVSHAGAVESDNAFAQALAWSGNGYAVAWHDTRNSGTTGTDIYATLLDSAGAIANSGLAHDLAVSSAASAQQYPAIAWSRALGQYVAAWEDNRSGAKSELYGATLAAPGGSVASLGVLVSGAGNSYGPSLADSGNGLGMAWHDTRDGNLEIYFARLASWGGKVGSDLRLTSNAAASYYPRIVWAGGEYGVVWEDYQGGGFAESWFQRVSQPGAAVGGNVQVSFSGGTLTPDVAFGGKGFLISGTANPGPVILQSWGCSADSTPPACPGNFNAYNITGTSATVTWSPSGDMESDVAYYQVFRNNTLVGKTSYEYYNDGVPPLPPMSTGNTYNYMIQPVNAWQLQNTGCTASVYVRTNASLTLTLNKASPDALLNWTDAGFNNYNIFRGTSAQVMSQIGATPALTAPDANALADTLSYFYSVDNPGP